MVRSCGIPTCCEYHGIFNTHWWDRPKKYFSYKKRTLEQRFPGPLLGKFIRINGVLFY
jgi:hypothetical protein